MFSFYAKRIFDFGVKNLRAALGLPEKLERLYFGGSKLVTLWAKTEHTEKNRLF